MSRSPRIEDPRRLKQFSHVLDSLDWSRGERRTALDSLAGGLADLCRAEIDYYYAGRRRSDKVSQFLRISAVLSATVGFILPLVPSDGIGEWGYVSLAVAGGLIMANRLLTATANHRRYVTAQLRLESLLVSHQVRWQEFLALTADEVEMGDEALAEGFDILAGFISAVHGVLEAETAAWGEEILDELERFANKVGLPSPDSPET